MSDQTINATEAALALAEENGIDLKTITGSGKDGAITKPDVQAVVDALEADAEIIEGGVAGAPLAPIDPDALSLDTDFQVKETIQKVIVPAINALIGAAQVAPAFPVSAPAVPTAPKAGDLPADFPYRDKLERIGVTTYAELAAHTNAEIALCVLEEGESAQVHGVAKVQKIRSAV